MSWKHRANHPRQVSGVRVGQFFRGGLSAAIAPVYPITPIYQTPLAGAPVPAEAFSERSRCERFPMIYTRIAEPLRSDLITELNAGLTEVRSNPSKWAYWADHFWYRYNQLSTLGFDTGALAEIKEVEKAIREARVTSGFFSGTHYGSTDLIDALLARCVPVDTTVAPLTGPTPEPTPVRGPIYYQGAGRYIPPQGSIR